MLSEMTSPKRYVHLAQKEGKHLLGRENSLCKDWKQETSPCSQELKGVHCDWGGRCWGTGEVWISESVFSERPLSGSKQGNHLV